jgi:hypothetical protein
MTAARILLLRHAEPPADVYNPHLSEIGRWRAENLAHFLRRIDATPTHYAQPDFIFAATSSRHSQQPYETVKPLSDKSGVPIDTSYADADFPVLAKELLELGYYAGKFAVICWHHGPLPDFARALRTPAGTYPDPWPADTFNLVLDLDYRQGNPPLVTCIEQVF